MGIIFLTMKEPFVITANHAGKEKEFEAQLFITGYSHRFRVMIDGMEVFFERDEDGNYRAVAATGNTEPAMKKIDAALLQSISIAIEAILK